MKRYQLKKTNGILASLLIAMSLVFSASIYAQSVQLGVDSNVMLVSTNLLYPSGVYAPTSYSITNNASGQPADPVLTTSALPVGKYHIDGGISFCDPTGTSGEVCWLTFSGNAVTNTVFSYSINGTNYITVPSYGNTLSSGSWLLFSGTPTNNVNIKISVDTTITNSSGFVRFDWRQSVATTNPTTRYSGYLIAIPHQ